MVSKAIIHKNLCLIIFMVKIIGASIIIDTSSYKNFKFRNFIPVNPELMADMLEWVATEIGK